MYNRNRIQNFRHRGFESSMEGKPIIMIFGDGPEPTPEEGEILTKKWDNDVEQKITVTPHVEPKAPEAASA